MRFIQLLGLYDYTIPPNMALSNQWGATGTVCQMTYGAYGVVHLTNNKLYFTIPLNTNFVLVGKFGRLNDFLVKPQRQREDNRPTDDNNPYMSNGNACVDL